MNGAASNTIDPSGVSLVRVATEISKSRVQFVLCAVVFVVALQLGYEFAIAPRWAYGGFDYQAPPLTYRIAFSAIALIPALWMPLYARRPSEWLYLYVYAAAFIPSCLVPLLRSGTVGQSGTLAQSPEGLIALVLVMLVCMAILGSIYRLPLIRIPRLQVPPLLFWGFVAAFSIGAYAIVYRVFGGSLRFTVGADVVAQRLLGGDVIASSESRAFVGYALVWPPFAINAFLLSYGLWYRRRIALIAGVVGQFFIYTVNAARSVIATIPVALLLWHSLRQRRVAFGVYWMALLTGVVVLTTVLCVLPFTPWALSVSSSWTLLRTFVGPGYLTGIFTEFFSQNPQTLFSHVRGLDWLAENPYGGQSLGRVIGAWLGQPNNNANANFFADGFASYGFLGMLMVTVLTAATFYALDSALKGVDVRVAITALGPHALNLADLPIFTSLLGGGLAFLVLLVYLAPHSNGSADNDPNRASNPSDGRFPLGDPSGTRAGVPI